MTGQAPMLGLEAGAMDRLMPMHVMLGPTGHILHAGPTICRVAGRSLTGLRFLEAFEVRRPRGLRSAGEMLTQGDGRIYLTLRAGSRLGLKGLVQPAAGGGLLVNLSFGISVVEAIATHRLTGADFAPTDLSVEMLYLAEARAAVMGEALKLNERLEEARNAAEAMAMSDTLTGLENRRAMDEAVAGLIARNQPFGLMHVDLDYFKDVNDTLGHAAGDAVLAEAARVLKAATRAGDRVGRVGGDEFVVLCAGLTDPGRLTDIAWRIVTGLERPIPWGRRACRISGSVGIVTTAAYDSPDSAQMMIDADQALYASKRAGRATVTVFGDHPGIRPAVTEVRSAG